MLVSYIPAVALFYTNLSIVVNKITNDERTNERVNLMIGWIVQATALSLCLIAVLHYLYVFFKTTLTVPKVKDLVNRPQKQYDAIFKTMGISSSSKGTNGNNGNNGNNSSKINSSFASSDSTTDISSLPILGSSDIGRENNAMSMKQELKHFLKELNSNSNNK